MSRTGVPSRPAYNGFEAERGRQDGGARRQEDCRAQGSRTRVTEALGWGCVCPYIKAGPATREGGGETGDGGEARRKRQAAPLISTRWLSPPGTSEINGEGGGEGRIFRKCSYSSLDTWPRPFPYLELGLFLKRLMLLALEVRLRLLRAWRTAEISRDLY